MLLYRGSNRWNKRSTKTDEDAFLNLGLINAGQTIPPLYPIKLELEIDHPVSDSIKIVVFAVG